MHACERVRVKTVAGTHPRQTHSQKREKWGGGGGGGGTIPLNIRAG